VSQESGARPIGVVGLGPTDPGSRIDFSLVLAQPHRLALRRYLRALDNPRARNYRRYLPAEEYGRRFGVSDRSLARARRAVEAAGLRVTAGYPQRTSLSVSGTAASVGRFLNTRFFNYRDAKGRHFHAPARRPTLPPSVAGTIIAAAGLDNRPLFHFSAVRAEGLKPADTAAAYNITPLHRRGLRGQGQSVAIVSFSGFNDRDVAEFDRRVGIRDAPPVRRVRVREGAPVDPDGQVEVNLDIDVIRGVAPRAQIYNYESPNGIGFAPVIDQIVADDRVNVISISWGMCDSVFEEEAELAAQRIADQRAFEAAVARGISVFAASGDDGAYDCQAVDPTDHRLTVDFPAASQFVIGVGGTLLSVRRDGSYAGEAGWQDTLSGGGGGGGLSTFDARPSWQRGRGVDNVDSNGKRQIPDVAASADSDSGYFVIAGGVPRRVGGTSAAAPLWAGSTLLIAQLAQREGARPLGFLAPLLYRLAEHPNPPFHDVVRGGNRHFDAGPGWDYATGLGTPNVARLASSMATMLKR
jgi:subtilase family serine protease